MATNTARKLRPHPKNDAIFALISSYRMRVNEGIYAVVCDVACSCQVHLFPTWDGLIDFPFFSIVEIKMKEN